MELNKRNRSELKQYFRINDKPTQEEFADFIDASINQAEDGIVKILGDPLAIQAEGDAVGALGVIDVFKSFSDENPEWSINLNPRTDPDVSGSIQPGFNIKDSTGQSKLFIKAEEGNVGIGTIEPTSKLTVLGKNTPSLISAIDTTNEHTTVFEVSQEAGKGILSLRNNENSTITQLSGAIETPNFFLGKMGVGTNAPKTHLHVSDKNAQLRITNTDQTNGTSAKLSLENEGSSERWEIGVQKGQSGLAFGTTNGGTNKIVMKTGGKLELTSLTVSAAAEVSSLTANGAIRFGTITSGHLNQDGSLYRRGGNAHLVVNNSLFIRDTEPSALPKFCFNLNNGWLGVGNTKPLAPLSISGIGKDAHPDASMHITENSILFGGPNSGKQAESGQIVAGKYATDSLCIVGIGTNRTNRRIDLWAEGGLNMRGRIRTPESMLVAFSVSLSSNKTGNINPLDFGQENYNHGDHFKRNRYFIAPVKGMYLFTMTMRNNTGASVGWKLRLNDSDYVNGAGSESSERSQLIAIEELHMNSRTVLTLLDVNNKVYVEQFGDGGNDNYSSGFEGILLQAIM